MLEVTYLLYCFAGQAGVVHGIACWFDVLFDGSTSQRWLSTAPGQPTTHWYALHPFHNACCDTIVSVLLLRTSLTCLLQTTLSSIQIMLVADLSTCSSHLVCLEEESDLYF